MWTLLGDLSRGAERHERQEKVIERTHPIDPSNGSFPLPAIPPGQVSSAVHGAPLPTVAVGTLLLLTNRLCTFGCRGVATVHDYDTRRTEHHETLNYYVLYYSVSSPRFSRALLHALQLANLRLITWALYRRKRETQFAFSRWHLTF